MLRIGWNLWAMQNSASSLLMALILFGSQSTVLSFAAELNRVTLTSPSDALTLSVIVKPDGRSTKLVYTIQFHGKPVILDSEISLKLADGTTLGKQTQLAKSTAREISDRFRQTPGKRFVIIDHYREIVLDFVEQSEPQRRWQCIARAYDDGVAFRFRFPKQPDWSDLELAEEETQFNLPSTTKVTYLPLPGYVTSHEGLYASNVIEKIPADQLIDIPLLAETPGSTWISVTEANLTNYSGMFLKRRDSGTSLISQLSADDGNVSLAVRTPLPAESPWRVILVSGDIKKLLESDILLKLNAPSVIDDTSWIRPGITSFPWWNGYHEENLSIEPGLNTAFAKHYIDFCAEYGIPYHSLDGIHNTAWYGGPIVPYDGDDPTTPVDGLDIHEVLAYARQKGVRLRLWMHWQAAQAHMHRAFPLYKKWGIEGVMIDFMDRNDQDMVKFQRELLQLAADNQLTVIFHGAGPPTGLERTYPNLLNTEAVMNLEYNKWNEKGISPEHDVTVPFTRMLAGPVDYHQGSFRTVSPDAFRPKDVAPLVIGTPCRTLASYVVLQNHLPMMADYPTAYRRNELTRVAAQIPSTWDETVVIAGEVGELAAIARRSADEWWVGVMTDSKSREIELPLKFLDDGVFAAEVYRDKLDAPQKYQRTIESVTSQDQISLLLTEGGGSLICLTPKPIANPGWRLVWSDDFQSFDHSKWRNDKTLPVDKRLHIVPEPKLVSINNGELSLKCDKSDVTRVGRVVSSLAQRYGRWEVRAKLPSSGDVESIIRLLPDVPWPSGGEIRIMTSNSHPQVTSSEFHWGTRVPLLHDSRVIPQRTSMGGKLSDFTDAFHTYAVEWTPDQLRFYVDDIHHTTFYSDEVGDFFPNLVHAMNLSIEARTIEDAENFGRSRGSLREMLIDWVRVYEVHPSAQHRVLVNGGYERSGGSLNGWHVFGNQMKGEPNVRPAWQDSHEGQWSLVLSGPSSKGESYSGVSQGIDVDPGQDVKAKVWCKVDSQHSLNNTNCHATLKVEFYKRVGDYFGGPGMLSFKELVIADRKTQHDEWRQFELTLEAPSDAVEARLSLVFAKKDSSQGLVFVDDVEFVAQDN